MKFSFQIIHSYPRQSVPSIVINFESRKYFFNTPETLQRFAVEHWVRPKKGSKIFLTQINTDHIGGVFGLLLTLFETKLAFDVQLFGPPGFTNYIDSIRFLFGLRILPYSTFDFFNNNKKLLGIKHPAFMDKVLSLPNYNKLFWNMNDYLLERQSESPADINDPEKSIKDGYYKDENIEIRPILLRPLSSTGKIAITYICTANKIPGKVNQEKVKAFNVPHKFIANILKARELEVNGVLYKASDFQEPDEPAPVLLIVDCPGIDYIDSLTSHDLITQQFNSDSQDQVLHAIIHILPDEVLVDQRYAEFLKKLPQNTRHVFINENLKEKAGLVEPEGMEVEKNAQTAENHYLKYRHFLFTNVLARYFPDHFPKLDDIPRTGKYDLDQLFPFLQYTSTNQKLVEFVMAPSKSVGFSKAALSFEKLTSLINYEEQEDFAKKYQKLSQKEEPKQNAEENQKALELFKNCDPEMVFLGTGSMKPSSFRNVSAIYLRFWQQNDIGFLLDCGEGTYFQLLNHYGAEKTRDLLKNLSVIFITHVHADHNLGLMKILSEREKVLREENIQKDPIYVVIPYNCATWLLKYSAVENLNYRIVFNQHINIAKNQVDISQPKKVKTESQSHSPQRSPRSKVTAADGEDEFEYYDDPDQSKNVQNIYEEAAQNVESFEKYLLENVGIVSFKTLDAIHCPQACAVLIEHKDGWKFVYSGDTRPSQAMVNQASPVTILVHESTFTSEMQKIAQMKMHSTEKEAIEIGMKMKAWRTVLTHFSQRFAKATGEIGSLRKYKNVDEKNLGP